MSRIEKVLILCPLVMTGGPEALHQLNGVLREKGMDAHIMYYGGHPEARVAVNQGEIRSTHSHQAQVPEAYRRYGVSVVDHCALNESLCVVVPEVVQINVAVLAPAQTALWWLSVDNALASARPKREPAAMREWMQSIPLHLAQSAYAAAWLNANGQSERWMLSDYTDPDFTQAPAVMGERERLVLFNPRKGGAAVERLQRFMPDWQFVPLQNFSKSELRQLMQRSRYYIDFGHHPGKDRLPREAAASGCVVMTLRAGAAQFFDDVPLASIYKFSPADIDSGALAQTLSQMDLEFPKHWQAQTRYRSRVRQERRIFEAEAMAVFQP